MLKKYGIHILIAILILMQLGTVFINLKNGVQIKDTVFVSKTIKAASNEFNRIPQQPIIIKNYITNDDDKYKYLLKSLKKKYKKQADSAIILRELLQAKKPKIYKESFKDSIIEADVTAYVTDKLDSLKFKYTRLPFTYKEQTIFVSPRFRVLAGANLFIKKENVIIGPSLGYQNRKGNYYGISAFTDKSVMVEAKFNIFEK